MLVLLYKYRYNLDMKSNYWLLKPGGKNDGVTFNNIIDNYYLFNYQNQQNKI